MKDPLYILEKDNSDSLNIKENFFKYLKNWPWFLGSIFLSIVFAFLFIRYTTNVYSTNAKIKIEDKSNELDIVSNPLSLLNGANPSVNLDNEKEILKSYRILSQVVDSLNLDIKFLEVGKLKSSLKVDFPLKITKNF